MTIVEGRFESYYLSAKRRRYHPMLTIIHPHISSVWKLKVVVWNHKKVSFFSTVGDESVKHAVPISWEEAQVVARFILKHTKTKRRHQ